MEQTLSRSRRARGGMIAASLTTLAIIAAAGCGGDDEETTTAAESGTDLSAVKQYLTDHSASLSEKATTMRELGDRYLALAEQANFDYAAVLEQNREEVSQILEDSKAVFAEANPAYEEMEGIVAGVPRLAQYDVDIDAGADASDPENAVSFSLELPSGETLKQPGNLFFVTETALYGTNPDFLAKGVKADLDGNGQVDFGEGLPDAEIYAAATREFESQAKNLDADAQQFEPTPSDA
ncbi:MAG: EfeM/EfeO family lipoprotein, partial [Solirubrobacterales bacterium]